MQERHAVPRRPTDAGKRSDAELACHHCLRDGDGCTRAPRVGSIAAVRLEFAEPSRDLKAGAGRRP